MEAAIKGSLIGVSHRYKFLVVVKADGAVRSAIAVLPPIDALVFLVTLYLAHQFLKCDPGAALFS